MGTAVEHPDGRIEVDGGPAFPRAHNSNDPVDRGMPLRDYFAAKVMEGDWSAQSEEIGYWENNTSSTLLERRAALYYRMADAMLKARNQ